MASPVLADNPAAGTRASRGQAVRDLVLATYLITGLALLPMVVGETLVSAGLVASIYDSGLPGWMVRLISGYEILVLLCGGIVLFVGWIPALIVCALFWRHWRMVLPASLLIAAAASMMLEGDARTSALGALAAMYTAAASLIGLEWLVRRILERRRTPPREVRR